VVPTSATQGWVRTFKKKINLHVKKKNPPKNDYDMDLWKYGSFRPFKSPLLYIWCIYVTIFFNKCFFLRVENLNLATNLGNYLFMPW